MWLMPRFKLSVERKILLPIIYKERTKLNPKHKTFSFFPTYFLPMIHFSIATKPQRSKLYFRPLYSIRFNLTLLGKELVT